MLINLTEIKYILHHIKVCLYIIEQNYSSVRNHEKIINEKKRI